jgi:pimeloyl-ACP methyl ester carboxylesterase
MKEAIVIVPGIMGSVLKDGDRVVWPGSAAEMVLPCSQMPALLKPGLIATDVIRTVSISRQYIQLIDAMSACGFAEANGTLTVFPYDWRKDDALAAAGLATHLDALVERLGDVTITLLAHSMGGLVSRCYLESGQYDGRSAFSAVKTLITMGTPHRGAPMALAAALWMERRLFLNKHEVQQVASDTNFPSLYQMLPPRHEPFVWERGDGLRSATHDLYDLAVATLLGLSEPNLASAQAFHAMLDLARKPKDVRYFAFAGKHESTANAMHYKDKGWRRPCENSSASAEATGLCRSGARRQQVFCANRSPPHTATFTPLNRSKSCSPTCWVRTICSERPGWCRNFRCATKSCSRPILFILASTCRRFELRSVANCASDAVWTATG